MNLKEYLLKALELNFFKDIKWYFSLFTIHPEGYEDKYMLIKNNMYYLKVNDESILLSNRSSDDPAISIKDKISLSKNELSNLKEDIETSVGILIANVVRLIIPFNNKVTYINKMFTDKDIEKKLPEMLKKGTITINEYLSYTDSASFILPLANIFTYSSTIKTITPPPNMKEEKKKIKEEFNKKYGEKWVKDSARVIEFGNRLKEIDNEYLKDDPSYGIMLAGKVTNNSRPRLYGSFGMEAGFDTTGKKGTFIENSLSEGYPTDKESLAALFNSARAGSYMRGSETQQGGTLAKDMLRPTSSLRIVDGDCGTKRGRPVTINKETHYRYAGSYILENGKTKIIENTEAYIGKTVIVRSPQYCIEEGDKFCSYCVNETMYDYKDGLPLLMLDAGGQILNAKMKAMHRATASAMKFNILEAIH